MTARRPHAPRAPAIALAFSVSLTLAGCPQGGNPDAGPPVDAARDVTRPTGPWCGLGSDVPGATVPAGYCMRVFAQVNSPRRLVVAPNGDVFVASPSNAAPGGSTGGAGAILLLTDDDGDGSAEVHTFLADVPDVHGLALGGGYLYFTTSSDVQRVPYRDGQLAASAAPESLNAPGEFGTGGRWTHGLALSNTGQLYASRGEYAFCGGSMGGTIYAAGSGSFTQVATGFRNPMYMRCHFSDALCVAAELGEDQTPGATEKLLALHPGSNYGYPCCFTTDSARSTGSDCSAVTREEVAIPLSDTPFGMDWERGRWNGATQGALFLALHGSFYSSPQYQGASVVYYPTDPGTHLPTSASFTEFVGGWGHAQGAFDRDSGSYQPVYLSRPADVAFGGDGRMFIADDTGSYVYWVAPTGLTGQGP